MNRNKQKEAIARKLHAQLGGDKVKQLMIEDVTAGLNAMRRRDPEVEDLMPGCWKCGCRTSADDTTAGVVVGVSDDLETIQVLTWCPQHPFDGSTKVLKGKTLPVEPSLMRTLHGSVLRQAIKTMQEAKVTAAIVKPPNGVAVTIGTPGEVGVLLMLNDDPEAQPTIKPVGYPWRDDEPVGTFGNQLDAEDAATTLRKGGSFTTLTGRGGSVHTE